MNYAKTLLVVLIVGGFISTAFAIDEKEIISALRSHMCPKEKIDTTGMPNFDQCEQYRPDAMKVNQCQNHEMDIWQRVLEYNKLFESCHQHDSSGQEYKTPPSKPPASALATTLQQAQQRAEEARAKAREAANKAAARTKQEAEKKELKEAVKGLPSWCQGMITACEQQAASLANRTQATQSQCTAYCQILKIENCNGGSSTVQQAAQACQAGASRDQKEAARQEKLRRQAEAERRARENYIPPGWVRCNCPDDHMYLVALGRAKLVNGVLYHPPDSGPCG